MSTSAGIRIDVHDIEFLTSLGRYGTLSTEDAHDCYPGMRRNSVQKRLRLLARCGFTRMTKLNAWFADDEVTSKTRSKGGRIPTLHSLTDEGAAFVERQTGECPPRVLRSNPSPATFLHRREIVRVMRAFDRGCQAVGLERPQWVMEQDAWHNAPQSRPPNQRRMLYHDMGNGLVCAPDIACRLRIGLTELAFFWEIDFSTEGRKQLRKASKTTAFVALINERAYRRYWPDLQTNHHYILWVCQTARRLPALRDVLRASPIAPVCRLLTESPLADPDRLLTSEVWETIDGQRRAIYRPSA